MLENGRLDCWLNAPRSISPFILIRIEYRRNLEPLAP